MPPDENKAEQPGNAQSDRLTGNYRSDIVLLSTWLKSHRTEVNRPIPRNKDNSMLSILTHLSTILTIGNRKSIRAENVHAVAGAVVDRQIQCLLFAENAASRKTKGPANGPSGVKDVKLVGKPDQGKHLLETWDKETCAKQGFGYFALLTPSLGTLITILHVISKIRWISSVSFRHRISHPITLTFFTLSIDVAFASFRGACGTSPPVGANRHSTSWRMDTKLSSQVPMR